MAGNARRVLLNKQMIELQRLSGVFTKLDAHHGFYLLKNCFSLPKLLNFLRTSRDLNTDTNTNTTISILGLQYQYQYQYRANPQYQY